MNGTQMLARLDHKLASALLGEVQAVQRALADVELALGAVIRQAAALERRARAGDSPELFQEEGQIGEQLDRIRAGVHAHLVTLWEMTDTEGDA